MGTQSWEARHREQLLAIHEEWLTELWKRERPRDACSVAFAKALWYNENTKSPAKKCQEVI